MSCSTSPAALNLARSASSAFRATSRNALWRLSCRQTSSDAQSLDRIAASQGQAGIATDEWMNVPPSILANLPRKLHLQKDHPVSITRQLIESRFPGFAYHNDLLPIVTTQQNFESLSIPEDHISRKRTDTYYFNKDTLLRTHTSAHQADVFRSNQSDGFLISADVYRRDAVDRSHYPIFHQMEGALTWDREKHGGNIAKAVWNDVASLARHDIKVEDHNPTIHPERNPLQPEHTTEEVEAVATHLKKSLENLVVEIFSKAREAAIASGDASAASTSSELQVRWVEAYFPFTSPSWELEVYWQDDWLEVLGCGVVRQSLPRNAGVPSRVGWAFGIGLERLAMLLFGIPDIRLFWSRDPRFLSQFAEGRPLRRFAPFSRHPECYKDVSFWLPDPQRVDAAATPPPAFHENDVMEIVRGVAGDVVEDVRFVDAFTHPRTQRESRCYRINYRSLERTLRNDEVNALHASIRERMVQQLGVEIR